MLGLGPLGARVAQDTTPHEEPALLLIKGRDRDIVRERMNYSVWSWVGPGLGQGSGRWGQG